MRSRPERPASGLVDRRFRRAVAGPGRRLPIASGARSPTEEQLMTLTTPAGGDTGIRPQDDLFGHVNGGWLETVEIPSDLPAIGGYIDLVLEAEAQVGDILRAASDDAGTGLAEPGSPRRKI